MKVWVAEHCTQHDGNSTLGVYSTYDKALAAAKKKIPKGELEPDGDWKNIAKSKFYENEWVAIWDCEIDE